MNFFPDTQTFISIGTLSIKWYAVLILTGATFSYFLSLKEIKKMGYTTQVLDDLFFGSLIAGIVGSRLWYVLFYDLQGYLANPISILMTWQGGMAIQGGLMLGALYAYFFLKKKNISFLRMADAIVPTILVAQAVGRWGNFVNQEAYGGIVDESFYALWPSFIKDMMLIGGSYRLPTFFFESALNLLGFVLIVYVLKRFSENRRGDLMYAYLMWYGVTRFWVEGFRTDSLMFMGLRTAQVLSVLYIILGVFGKLGLYRRLFKKTKPAIVFDFDGTLVDTEPLILASMKYTLLKYKPDLEITEEMEVAFLGPTLSETLRKYLDESLIEEAFETYRTHNKEIHDQGLKAYPMTKETLEELKAQGYSMAIFSSKKKDMVEHGLHLAGLGGLFEVIIGYDEVTKHKPDPEGLIKALKALGTGQDNVVYVGDSPMDIQAAQAIDAYTVAFLSHPKREKAVMDLKPNQSIKQLDELFEILKGDHEWTHSMM